MNSKAQTTNATEHAVGLDGYFTLLLSNLVLVATAGLYWLWLIKVVYRHGKRAQVQVANCDLLAVLGMRPENNQINAEFKTRLNRAARLFEHGYGNTILVIGGKTGNNTHSEAELGIQYLLKQGLSAENLLAEDHSRHTLENLHNAKRFFMNQSNQTAAIITSRYHLERSHRMASSLQLSHSMCAAEDEFKWDVKTLFNILKEAYFLHWYEIGKAWAYGINSQKSLNRIR
ncbi:YdcF family protein [Kaarinaea lacus]